MTEATAPTASQTARMVVGILSAANFVIGMGAFMVVGLLVPAAQDLGISEPRAGWMMTAYALSYAVLSPVLVSLTGRIGRRRILAIGFAIFALAAVLCALAPTAEVLFAARCLAAAGAGLVTPVGASVAAGLSPPDRQARALAGVFIGLTLAQVLGVPLGGWLAYTFGWRSAFWVVAALALPVLWLIWTRVPAGLSFAPVRLSDLGRTLGNLRHMLAVAFTSALMGAVYVVYTYLSPLLTAQMGYGRAGITGILMAFGIGAVIGNLMGGVVSDRIGPLRTLRIIAAAQILLIPVFSLLPLADLVLFAVCMIWASFGWGFMSAQQVRLIALDPKNAPVMLALNAAAIYVGAALGSAIGGAVIAQAGLGWLGLAGSLVAVCALVILHVPERMDRA